MPEQRCGHPEQAGFNCALDEARQRRQPIGRSRRPAQPSTALGAEQLSDPPRQAQEGTEAPASGAEHVVKGSLQRCDSAIPVAHNLMQLLDFPISGGNGSPQLRKLSVPLARYLQKPLDLGVAPAHCLMQSSNLSLLLIPRLVQFIPRLAQRLNLLIPLLPGKQQSLNAAVAQANGLVQFIPRLVQRLDLIAPFGSRFFQSRQSPPLGDQSPAESRERLVKGGTDEIQGVQIRRLRLVSSPAVQYLEAGAQPMGQLGVIQQAGVPAPLMAQGGRQKFADVCLRIQAAALGPDDRQRRAQPFQLRFRRLQQPLVAQEGPLQPPAGSLGIQRMPQPDQQP